MLFYFVEFGVPFDLGNDSFWEASSPSHLKGIGKELKGLFTGFNDYEICEFLKEQRSRTSEIFLNGTSKVESEICEHFYAYIESNCTFLEDFILKNKNKKAVKRYCYFRFSRYHLEFDLYIKEKQPRVTSTWFYKYCKQYIDKCFKKYGDNFYNIGESYQLHEGTTFLTEEKISELESLKQYMFYRHYNHSVEGLQLPLVVTMVFKCLSERQNVKESIIALWCICYMNKEQFDLFPYVLYLFSDVYKDHKSEFPYLNHALLDNLFKLLDAHNENSVINRYQSIVVLGTFMDYAIKQNFKDVDGVSSFIRIKSLANSINLKVNSIVVSRLIKAFDYARDLIQTFSLDLAPVVNEFIINKGYMSSLPVIETLSHNDAILIESEVMKTVVADMTVNLEPSLELIAEQTFGIDSIQDESLELAKNPLDNISRLQELASLRVSHFENIKASTEKVSEVLISCINRYESIIKKYSAKSVPQANPLTKQVRELEDNLELATLENDRLNSEKQALEARLTKALTNQYTAPIVIEKELSFENLINVMESKSLINDIVTLILNSRPWVVPSDRLLKQLSDIKSFARPAELAKQLITLTSPEFIKDYSENGSAAAFKYFSKSALSFKESETTMSVSQLRRQREFPFHGQSICCEAHLRIGINNTEQEQLRIHFKIEKGNVYLGYIGRHLPISSS